MKLSLNASVTATLLLVASAVAFAQCPTAKNGNYYAGGTCKTGIFGGVYCTQPGPGTAGTCPTPLNNSQKCYTSTQVLRLPNWKPKISNNCSGGCITDGTFTDVTDTPAWNANPCVVESSPSPNPTPTGM